MLPSIFTFLFLLPCLILSSTTEDQREIAPESMQFIRRVPCVKSQGRCSFKDFAELRGEENFLEEWISVLYFDFDKYTSHNVIRDTIMGKVNSKLFKHKILFGQVLCHWNTTHIPSHAKLCKNMDPTNIYIFQNWKKTRYGWTVEDFVDSCPFIISALLAMQYSGNIQSVKSNNFDEELKQKWLSNFDSRKFMLVIHLGNMSLEVEAPYTSDRAAVDRLLTLDLVGAVYKTIPDVRILTMNETNSTGVKFWWYDSRWCPNLSEPNCKHHYVHIPDFRENDADSYLCEIEKFSSGLNLTKSEIDLRPNSTASRWEESNRRLLLACPFILFNAESEEYENIKSEFDSSSERIEGMVIIGDRETALNISKYHEANLVFKNFTVLVKILLNQLNKTDTDVFLRNTSVVGLRVTFFFEKYSGESPAEFLKNQFDAFKYGHYKEDYENLGDGDQPYQFTDELSFIVGDIENMFTRNVSEPSEMEFQRRTASDQPPATVLFYMEWSSASLIARYVIFPSASNELASRFNRTERLYAVNCFKWNEVCQKQGIDRYPTVKLFVRGSSRRLETVVSLAEILRETVMLDMEPLLEAKTPEEVTRALNMSAQLMDHAVLGVGLKDAQVLEEFRKTAVAFKRKALFILLQHRDLPQNLQARIPNASVASYIGRLRPDLFIKDPPLHADLAQFVTEARFNRVMELTWTLFQEFQATKRPLLVLLLREMTPKFECLLSDVVAHHRGQFHVTWAYMYMPQKTPFPIFEDIKEPTVVLSQAGSIYRWRVKSSVEDETDCPIIGLELDLWLDSIKEGKKSPDEFVKKREYSARQVHYDSLDDVYPRSETDNPNEKLWEKQMEPISTQVKPNSTETTEKDIGYSKFETATLPKSTTMQSTREDL